jgi:hypothetical protein
LVSQIRFQFLATSTDRLDINIGDLGQQEIATFTYPVGFHGYIPTALLLIQATQKQIYLVMQLLIWMKCFLLATGTLTNVYLGYRHWYLR